MYETETELYRPRRLARVRRKRREGMTLVEIMIVVIIMALIATAVGIAVLPQFSKAKVKTAESDVQAIDAAVQLYLMQVGDECPTVENLVEEGVLDSSKNTIDPWGNDYAIECEGDNVTVISAGEDEQPGTEDDITS
jgi:general secretion pathway protein G